ncbi:MarR family transcriptional regulator [Halopenitus persicus]|uniref:Transcriptional regulator, ArsR family n=1 Tax=Halopenitus persicus TaxID=1048396 RepID=A0A1H3IKE4_9EURY|nr:helix-turn-helix domain-containing protein [Halopenitus persicus]QHS17128.1 MarR family transcriptional regulator [haloarchaeon 3A1-DGR]SDY27759.1 transcriptional regulator, ArsR family [Halopenitus persicus]
MSAPEAVRADNANADANADADDVVDRWEPVRDLPPSAKLVAKVLDYNETLTQSELAEETLLPPRTVRYALSRLEEEDVVDSRFSFADARKRLYSLSL